MPQGPAVTHVISVTSKLGCSMSHWPLSRDYGERLGQETTDAIAFAYR